MLLITKMKKVTSIDQHHIQWFFNLFFFFYYVRNIPSLRNIRKISTNIHTVGYSNDTIFEDFGDNVKQRIQKFTELQTFNAAVTTVGNISKYKNAVYNKHNPYFILCIIIIARYLYKYGQIV